MYNFIPSESTKTILKYQDCICYKNPINTKKEIINGNCEKPIAILSSLRFRTIKDTKLNRIILIIKFLLRK